MNLYPEHRGTCIICKTSDDDANPDKKLIKGVWLNPWNICAKCSATLRVEYCRFFFDTKTNVMKCIEYDQTHETFKKNCGTCIQKNIKKFTKIVKLMKVE